MSVKWHRRKLIRKKVVIFSFPLDRAVVSWGRGYFSGGGVI